MSFLFLVMACIVVFIGTVAAIGFGTRFRMRHRQFCPIESTAAGVLTFIAFLLVLLLNPSNGLCLPVSLLGLSMLVLFAETLPQKLTQYGLQYLACLLGAAMLSPALPVFQAASSVVMVPVLAAIWFIMMRLIASMDKIQYLSLILVMTQGIFFSLLGLFDILPEILIHTVMFMAVAAIAAVGTVRFWTQKAQLGSFAAIFVGFAVGGCLTYIAACGFMAAPVIVLSYYGLEWLIAVVGGMVAARSFAGQARPTFFEQAWNKDIARPRLLKFVLFCLILINLICLVIFIPGSAQTLNALVVSALILVGIFVQLKNWGTPRPTYKDLFHDLKNGMVALKQEAMTVPLKKDTSKSPRPVKKKTRSGQKKK